jgi:heterodisulfide reductase subunit A
VITWVVLAAVFLAVVAVTPMGIAYAKRTGKLDKPSMRKIHKEPTPSIGGHMSQLDKTFPTNDCSM